MVFGGVIPFEFVHVVPKNIPALANVKTGHLLSVHIPYLELLMEGELVGLEEIVEGSKVHKIACIYADINTIEQMHAFLIPAHCAGVFDVIDNKGAIMNDFAEGSYVVNFLFGMPVQLGNQHAQDGSPSLASPIEQVIDGLGQTFSQGRQVAGRLPIVQIAGENFQAAFRFESAGDDFLNGPRVIELLRVAPQNFQDGLHLLHFDWDWRLLSLEQSVPEDCGGHPQHSSHNITCISIHGWRLYNII